MQLAVNVNNYMKVTDMKLINDTKEQVLSGFDFNVSTQLPYSPWAILTYREYEYKTEKSSSDIEGEEYSLGLDINPTLVLDLKVDNSKNQSTDNVYSAKINFVYPPKENKKTMVDGFSEDRYEKETMKDKVAMAIDTKKQDIAKGFVRDHIPETEPEAQTEPEKTE